MTNFKKYIILLGCLLGAGQVWASSDVTISPPQYDLMSPPSSNISIWNNEAGMQTPGDIAGSYYGWVCHSNSDPVMGACAAEMTGNTSGSTPINVQFVEKRSGMKQVLTLQGTKYQGLPGGGCNWQGPYPMNSMGHLNVYCYSQPLNTSFLTVTLPGSELGKLPVGGVWEATLKLQLVDANNVYLAEYTAHITLSATDKNHADIYLPAYGEAAPLVELDLHPRGAPDGNAYAQDVTSLDMCLYDGYNANSTRYDVTLKDEGRSAPGRDPKDFSIYRDKATTDEAVDRIDYHVQMQAPTSSNGGGGLIDVANNQDITLTNINNGEIRPVRLPNMRYPVLCVPTPLILSVDKFNVMDKNEGFYQGTLTVTFTPTTLSVD
ncbi:CfaE/CblD family pilus tip adhesin [Edaphovirga cremea]|uniref:CfaE/CblD family pilus tip adhesin n=2 Tax=Edaphovirga cremea TaxID=2267246 RepID=UPI0013001A38|nr:CfaE/CblD family pilus tip adhesin [Edaphovirga cremea]